MPARLDQLDRLTEPAAASARPAPTPGPGHPHVHAGHGGPRPHCLSEVLSPHCLACGGRGHHVFHLPGSSSVRPCAACGGRATAGLFVVRLAALDLAGADRWSYEFRGPDTAEFERAVERCRTAARWVGAMTRLPALRREVRVVYVSADAPRGRVLVRERAGPGAG